MTKRSDAVRASEEAERLSYPIGRFRARTGLSAEERRALIDDLSALPTDLRTAVSDLSAEQLDTPYRPAGWTVRQVVHHLPDSHMNGYVRFKLAMTEDEPKVRSYNEASWAQLIDARGEDIESSLVLLEMLHRRWVRFLRSLAENQFRRIVLHPERGRLTLEYMLQLYAWHGRHHLAHIERLREWMGW